ncbi:hypothetical protein [Streptomyces sp. WAC06614]|uniref:hypothetical protein n=1 Tax=Streptomyces sp. WAC06614 TaxID=2487416 RepID=UPI000F7B62E6|nr:hypothetical protein [Streptomyces sp. WAC06614]RSS79498.1 hypothetical protein EF918_17200 [Streptomyces sp. WAC06614]
MFEIRIICDPTDANRITTDRGRTFATSPARRLASRTPGKERLYFTAEHRPDDTRLWPSPEASYAKAPSVISEIGWTARHVRDALDSANPDQARVFWLRKAALLDRIALADERNGARGDALEAAIQAAHRFRVYDSRGDSRYHGHPHDPDSDTAFLNPRGYVRQEYALWIGKQ